MTLQTHALACRRTPRGWRAMVATAVLATTIGMGKSSSADDSYTVRLRSGRTFTAAVDPRSDERHLWLKFGSAGLEILRPVEWSSVDEIRRGERVVEMGQFKLEIQNREAIGAAATAVVVASAEQATPDKAATMRRNGGLRLWSIAGDGATAARRPLRSIDVDAYLANWDADVEADGVVLTFAAIDETGVAKPVSGTLYVELVGERYPPLSRGNALPIYARWSDQVEADESTIGGEYRRRFEFQALHPDYHLWLSRYALVHVRLTIPGEGTFEASIDGVRLRGFTPVRDRTQQAFGTRFLPTEATGRGHRESAGYSP